MNAIGGFDNHPRKYEPYSNHYNPGLKDHPNFKYGQPPNQQPFRSYANENSAFPLHQVSNSDMFLREIVKSLAINTQMFQETRASIQNLKTKISQLASFVRNIEINRGKLSSQAKINPKENASAMTLRSGREVQTILPAAMPGLAANMLPIVILDPARNIPPIAAPNSTTTVVQTS